ncbi:MAG: twin-arginine translocase subunit TatC [Thermoleophilia bacterium]|nr:twin-arginine translocase subunit TatC [Thermoleophilia bacterium]
MLAGLRGTRRLEHQEEVPITDHLEELRNRIIISAIAVAIGFGFCFWKHELIIEFLNRPLPPELPVPIVLGVAEPFTIALKVALAGAIVLAIPILIYQLYAYVMPAFDPDHDRRTWPYLVGASGLFFIGLAFGYFAVLPPALSFLVGFDSELYNRQVDAGNYYGFVVQILIACGLIFQMPSGVFVLTTVGLMRSSWMRKNRRYAIFLLAVVAAALPSGDVVSMMIIFVALLGLYEISIMISAFVERNKGEAEAAEAAEFDDAGDVVKVADVEDV